MKFVYVLLELGHTRVADQAQAQELDVEFCTAISSPKAQ